MAIWQFTVELVPRTWSLRPDANVAELLAVDGYDTSIAWRNNQPTIDAKSTITKFVPVASSWCPEIRCWGIEQETDVQLSYNNGCVESIKARVDARSKVGVICSKIVEISKILDCVLYLPELESIIEPTVFGISRAVSESRAAKFADNPQSIYDESL